jgi:hypothetical protein
MSKLIRYRGPSNVFDARTLFARDDAAYRFTRGGAPVEVDDDEADELLSYPGQQFVEVDPATVAPDEAAERRARLAEAAATRQAKAKP